MASLCRDTSGWRVQFVSPATGQRVGMRLGLCAEKNAQTFRNMVERLIEARKLGQPIGGRTADWVNSLGSRLRQRLARAGLIDLPEIAHLGGFLDAYIAQRKSRGDVTASTIEVWGHTRRNLVDCFGTDRDMRAITTADADEWAAWLRSSERLAENTIRKRCQFAKMFFAVAVRRKLIPENPFVGLVGTVVSVPERQHFIDRKTVDALLDQCQGPEYRLLLVVARYMGVRVPSEIHPLKWTDVNWETLQMVITSPKTKRHKGRAKRVCPIFPEVLPFLQEAWEAALEGAFWIFPSIRSGEKNLRTWLERAIIRAGFQPWPRLWQNFRATRATELADQYPSHVAAAWLGHTERIADRHYRQVTSAHYQQAAREPTGAMPKWRGPEWRGGVKMAQHTPAQARTRPEGRVEKPGKTGPCSTVRRDAGPFSGGHGTRTRNPGQGAPHFQ